MNITIADSKTRSSKQIAGLIATVAGASLALAAIVGLSGNAEGNQPMLPRPAGNAIVSMSQSTPPTTAYYLVADEAQSDSLWARVAGETDNLHVIIAGTPASEAAFLETAGEMTMAGKNFEIIDLRSR